MPFAPKYKQDDPNAQQQSGQAAPSISGVSAGFNVPGATGVSNKAQKTSGQYQNLDKYINANQAQGQQMGEKIAGDVGSEITGAQNKVGSVVGQVQKTSAFDPNSAISNAGSLTPDQQANYKATKSTGGYTGPADISGLQGYGDAYTASQNAKVKQSALGSNVGQQELLKQSYASPSYSQGANKLDQVLVQGSTGGQAAMSGLANKYKDLSSQFDNQFNQASTDIAASQAQAKLNKAAFAPAETQAMDNLMNPLKTTADKYNRINTDLSDVNTNGMDQETLDYLGIPKGANTFGFDLSKFVNPDKMPFTIDNVATNDQRNKYSQLNDLFDQQGNVLTSNGGKEFKPFDVERFKLLTGNQAPSTNVPNFTGQVAPEVSTTVTPHQWVAGDPNSTGASGFSLAMANMYPSFGEGKGSMSDWIKSGLSPEEYSKGDASILKKIKDFAAPMGLTATRL